MASGSGVSRSIRFAYAAPAFALAVVGIPVYVYLPKFYTDVVGLDIGVLGILLLAARLFDAGTDPMIGLLSDRTQTRFGRRRPWIAGAVIPLAIAIVLLFSPPEVVSGGAAVWFGVSLFALFLFWTAVTVPYESLGAEITFDHHERTSLLGTRDGLLMVGTLLAATSPELVRALFALGTEAADERAVFARIAWIYAPLMVVACFVCARVVPERPVNPEPQPRLELGPLLKNRPFRVLLSSYTVAAIGSNLPATLILYYVEYVLHADGAGLYLVMYFATGILFLPFWIHLSRRLGKKNTWLISMLVNTGAFVAVFFLGPGDTQAYAALVCLSGVGFGATLAIPSAMQADVIDYDQLLTGKRREGLYIGVWSISKKLAAALGVGIALPILGAAGYEPNVEQGPQVVWTLRVLYAGVPCACNLVAIAIAMAYPIDERMHNAILDASRRRDAGERVPDPLRQGRFIEAGA